MTGAGGGRRRGYRRVFGIKAICTHPLEKVKISLLPTDTGHPAGFGISRLVTGELGDNHKENDRLSGGTGKIAWALTKQQGNSFRKSTQCYIVSPIFSCG
ncbi:MAG: hypothetical protein ABI476_04715 [Oxalobacteraceae bacterium]